MNMRQISDYFFRKAIDYFDAGDHATTLARGVAGVICFGICLLILWSIAADSRRAVGPRYFKWLAGGEPVPESHVARCTRDCTPTCTADYLTVARESAPSGQWQPRIDGELRLFTPDGCRVLGYRVLTAKQVPLWCGTDLIEVEADDVDDADGDIIVCRTWREIKRFRWTCEDMVAYAKWCAEDAGAARAADWTPRAAMARAVGSADLDAFVDAISRSFFRLVSMATGTAANAETCDERAAGHAAEAAACARQSASATSATAAAGAARQAALQAVSAACEASGGASAFPCTGIQRGIHDAVSARQRKWIEERIGESLKG